MKNKYLIGEVSKLFNVTRDTLVHYDKIGVLSPQKDSNNGYRYYEMDDLNCLTDIILFKGLNISLSDINDILRNSSPSDILKLIEEKEAYLEEQVNNIKKLSKKLSIMKEDVKVCTDSINKVEFGIEKDNCFFIEITKEYKFNDFIEIVEKFGGFDQDWYDYGHFAFLIDEGALFDEDAEKKIKWGITFQEDYHKIKELNMKHKLEHVSNNKYMYTVIALNDDTYETWIDSIEEIVITNNIEVSGSILGRMLLTVYENETPIDYYEVYIPIK